jgi:hypothetical protein
MRKKILLFGNKLDININFINITPKIFLKNDSIEIYVNKEFLSENNKEKFEKFINNFLKERLMLIVKEIVKKWEKILNVKVDNIKIRKMKRRWGTCYFKKNTIILNFKLHEKLIECIEYVVVHEMIHLIIHNHSKTFYSYMGKYLPNWKKLKYELNELNYLKNFNKS